MKPQRIFRSKQGLRKRQHGVVLFLVLVALVALMLAALAMFRSVDTSVLLAGNLAFRKGASAAADAGIEAAAAALPNIIATSHEAVIPGQYYPTITVANGGLAWDANGLPPSSVWASAPADTTSAPGYSVQYIIERMCTGQVPVVNVLTKCVADVAPDTGSNKSGALKFTSSSAVYYRVTVYVTGPHNTATYVQAMFSD